MSFDETFEEGIEELRIPMRPAIGDVMTGASLVLESSETY